MAASGQASPEGCAEIPAAPGGSTAGASEPLLLPGLASPRRTWLRPQSFFICAHPLSLELLQPPPCLLHSQPAVSALPRASALGQSPRWLLLLCASPSRARSQLDRAARTLWKRWAGNPPSPRVPAGSEDLTFSAGSLRVCTPPAPAPRAPFRRSVPLRVPAPPRSGLRRCPTLSGHAPRVGSTNQSPGARAGAEPGLPTLPAGVPGKRAEHRRLEWAGSKWPPLAEPRPRYLSGSPGAGSPVGLPQPLPSFLWRSPQLRTLRARTSLETILAGLLREALELLCFVLPLASCSLTRSSPLRNRKTNNHKLKNQQNLMLFIF